jgi:glycosyltransferase involved in cell wall biosynthesis
MRVAVVIPAFNEAATVADVAERALRYTQTVFVVDDGSGDDTAAQLLDLPVTLLRNDTNLGKAASMARGFVAALEQSMDAVITLDADGQHRPEDIPRLIATAAAYPGDIVIAARLQGRERMPRSRRFGNWQADFWIAWAAGYPIRDTQCGYRLYPAALLERLAVRDGRRNSFVFESEVLIEAARIGCYARSISIDTIYGRSPRESHYRAASDTMRIVLMVAGNLIRRGLSPLGLLRSLGLLPHPGIARNDAGAKRPDALS